MQTMPEVLAPEGISPGLTDAEIDAAERRLEQLAALLDSAWSIPGTSIRFGADSLLGFIPGIGDALGLLLSGYIVSEAKRLGAPPSLIARMSVNVGIDAAIGAIPVLGDLFDVAFKANLRNAALLREHLANVRSRRPKVVSGQQRPLQRVPAR